MSTPLFSKLVERLGERRAHMYIERLLKNHIHTSEIVKSTSSTPAEIESWRASEKKLFSRLCSFNQQWDLDLTIEDTSKKKQCGDVIVTSSTGIKSVWDCKHYSGTVPLKEMKKLARDARVNKAAFAVMLTTTTVARTKCFTETHVDGVPIHVTKLNSPGEFACLYLTTLSTQTDESRTINATKSARLFQLVASMEQSIQEIKSII